MVSPKKMSPKKKSTVKTVKSSKPKVSTKPKTSGSMTASQKKKLVAKATTAASIVAGVGLGALAIAKEIKKRKAEQAKQSQMAQAMHKSALQRLKDAVSKYTSKKTPPKPSSPLQMFEMY